MPLLSKSALSEGLANTVARAWRSVAVAAVIAASSTAVAYFYGSTAEQASVLVEEAIAAGEFTWEVTAPGSPLQAMDCHSVAANSWIRSSVGLKELGVGVLTLHGSGIEMYAYSGSLAALDPMLRGDPGVQVLAGPSIGDRVSQNQVVIEADGKKRLITKVDTFASGVRFPQFANALLFPEPLASIDTCIVEGEPTVTAELEPLIEGHFEAEQLLVSPVSRSMGPTIAAKVVEANSPVVRLVCLAVLFGAISVPCLLDRREKGLLRTLGWPRFQIFLMYVVEACCVLVVGGLVSGAAIAIFYVNSKASEAFIYAAIHTLVWLYSASIVLVLTAAAWWSRRSPRSLLLAQ